MKISINIIKILFFGCNFHALYSLLVTHNLSTISRPDKLLLRKGLKHL